MLMTLGLMLVIIIISFTWIDAKKEPEQFVDILIKK